MFFGNGITIGKLFNITIRIDYSWFIIFILITQSFTIQYFHEISEFDLFTSIILGLITSLLVFASVLVHEFSHSLVGNAQGARIKRITLFIFGGAAELSGEPKSASAEFKMTVVGPVSSIALGFLMWGLLIFARDNDWPAQVQAVVETLRYFNFAVGIFNLLPGYPLDGGRLVRSFLWWKKRDFLSATRIAAGFGKAIGYGFMLIGLGLFIFGDPFSGIWLAFIGFFLSFAANMSVTQSEVSVVLSGVKVSDLMTKQVESVKSDLTVSDFIANYMLKRKMSGYPVLKNGKLVGMVYIDKVAKKGGIRKNMNILSITTKLKSKQTVAPNTSAYTALKIMGQDHLPSLPVLRGGRLVGIISQTDINHFLTAKSMDLD
jgi:Zn-dependent protease/predicted transcriptional regulator